MARSGFVAIVGPANAGKSTLLNALLGKKISIVSPKPQTTRNRILGIKTTDEYQLVLVDSPGTVEKNHGDELTRRLKVEAAEAGKEADVCLLLLDTREFAKDLSSGRSAVEILGSLRRAHRLKAPVIIGLNKIDLIEKLKLLPLIAELSQAAENTFGEAVEIVPLSALKEDGLKELEKAIVKLLPEGPNYFPADTVTDQTEEAFAAEVIREKLFFALSEEVPYSVAVRIEQWKREENLLRIGAAILVERDSQKGIVIGKKGEKLKSIGTAARLELEKILGTRIFLELFVKVESNWTESVQGLRKAGYQEF